MSFDECADNDPNAYDCSICRASTNASLERPIGVTCMIVPTSGKYHLIHLIPSPDPLLTL